MGRRAAGERAAGSDGVTGERGDRATPRRATGARATPERATRHCPLRNRFGWTGQFRHHGGMLDVRQLSVEVGGRVTLEEASFTVRAGDKVGLVGRNGAGKTSLLKVLGGELPPAAGRVDDPGAAWGSSARILDPPGIAAAGTGLAHILSGRGLDQAADDLEKLRIAMEEAPVGTRHRPLRPRRGRLRVARRLRRRGRGAPAGRRPGPRRRSHRPAHHVSLSGGERRRVELARILFAGSDVLLLDEPTNHLDSDAKNWLMGFLRAYRGALLVVSHDLDLLDEAITRVLHLDEARLVEYKGTYSQYREARAADEVRLTRLVTRQQAEIKRLAGLADSMRHQTAKRARIAKSLDKRVLRLQAGASSGPGRGDRRYAVRFPIPPHTGRLVLEADGLAKAYGGPPVFEDVTFAVERGERLLIMGLNGAGKTSLLRILAGWSEPTAGTWRTGVGVSAGYYAQEHEGIRAGRQRPGPPPGRARHLRTRPPGAARYVWTGRRHRLPGRRRRCRAERRPSWRWRNWSRASTTCCSSTSRPTTSTRPPATPSARRWPTGRAP